MKQLWQIGNILSLVFALILNVLTGAQLIGLPAIDAISDQYATLLTPATYAFSIWSLIYALLAVFAWFQARDLLHPLTENTLPQQVGPIFIVANICNGLWTFVFVQGYIGLSLIILLILTASLYGALRRLNIARADPPATFIACVWWPLLIYTGWVTVATVVNAASWLLSVGYTVTPAPACAILIVLTAVLLWLLKTRHVRELVVAATWGIIATGVHLAQTNSSFVVMVTSFAASAVLLVATLYHAYLNRAGNPFLRRLLAT